MLVLERLPATRVVAKPEALDRLPGGLRLAPDEALFIDPVGKVPDEHAIVVEDHSFMGVWMSAEEAAELLERHCEWEPPAQGLAQGAVAGIPAKLWFAEQRVLILVQAPYADDFMERIA